MAKQVIRARVERARHYARNFRQGANELRRELYLVVKNLSTDAEIIFAAHAPKKSGRLARGVRGRAVGDTALITAHARNPRTGYDYVGVTRWGHKLKWIVPTRAWPRSGVGKKLMNIPDVGWRWAQPAPALKLPFGFFRRVRGYKPAGDWVEKAIPEVQREGEMAMAELGEQFVLRLAS